MGGPKTVVHSKPLHNQTHLGTELERIEQIDMYPKKCSHLPAYKAIAPLQVFEFKYQTLLKPFHQACRDLGIPNMIPCQARHSGASIDKAAGFRDL